MNTSNPTSHPIEPIVGTLRVAGGTRLDAAPRAAALPAPPRVARGREDERLFILLNLTGPASSYLYRELREVVAQTYWSATGSITAALRQATAAASRHLFRFNLRSDPANRCYGGLTCAVLHEEEVFLLQAGPTQPCVLREGRLDFFCDEELPPMGMTAVTDVRLHHTFITAGDTLLLTPPALIQEAGGAGLARVLRRAEVEEILAGLEQVGAGFDFSALVVRWASPSAASRAEAPAAPKSSPHRPQRRARPESRVRRRPSRKSGPGLGARMWRGILRVGRGVGYGIAAIATWLVGSVVRLFRRMLPGAERESRRRARPPRPIPKENRTVMMTIAIAILLLVVIIVTLAYYGSLGKEARFRHFLDRAWREISLTRDGGELPAETRSHWEAALDYANQAAACRPDDPEAAELQAQAQAALDVLDVVVHLTPVQLWNFGAGTAPRQLVVHGQMIFALDPAAGWVVQLTLNPTGDDVMEQEDPFPLVHTGQQIGGAEVGELVDFAWVEPGGERQTSGLVILEKGGVLVSYDPAWVGAGEDIHLVRSLLGTPPTGTSGATGSFEGRFYVLDIGDDQIWRYEPRGDTYPEQPDRYFVTPPHKSLATARDLAIDGNIYILYDDGTILKFFNRELQTFDVRGVPNGIGLAVALAVDPNGNSGVVYVADRIAGRVVALESDGAFRAQFCAAGVFDELESLAVDETSGRLYVIDGGRLYAASLP